MQTAHTLFYSPKPFCYFVLKTSYSVYFRKNDFQIIYLQHFTYCQHELF